mmetsp:Transcript_31149/g.74935  ORF Transcript_31149/g.74935 Transcript_31149/m.74935 type:complete len:175 (-) Transcript_31149:235-759(-)
MMDYLLMKRLPKSAELIKMILEETLVSSVEMWEGEVEKWMMDLYQLIESAEWTGDVTSRQTALESIIRRFESYAMIQATSTLELALWKVVVVNTGTPFTTSEKDRKRKRVNRESSRMTCGANVVIPAVLDYLFDNIKNRPVGNVAVSMLDYDASWMKGVVKEIVSGNPYSARTD